MPKDRLRAYEKKAKSYVTNTLLTFNQSVYENLNIMPYDIPGKTSFYVNR